MLFPALAGRETYIFHRVVGYGRMVRSGCSCGIAPALGAPVRTGAHVGGHNGAHVGAQNGAPKRSASRHVCPRRTDAASYASSRGLAPDEATGGHVRRRLRTRAPSPETRILRRGDLTLCTLALRVYVFGSANGTYDVPRVASRKRRISDIVTLFGSSRSSAAVTRAVRCGAGPEYALSPH